VLDWFIDIEGFKKFHLPEWNMPAPAQSRFFNQRSRTMLKIDFGGRCHRYFPVPGK
jgi:hypothetical protein